MNGYTVFLGDVALDEYYSVDSWPEDGGKAFANQLTPKHGGMIANAACVYAALGGNAEFMTSLNSSNVSKVLIDGLNESKVGTKNILIDNTLADSKCMIFLTKENNTVLILETGLEYYDLNDQCFETLENAEYIYSTLSDLLRVKYNDKTGMDVIKELKKKGTKIFCDLDTGYLDEEVEDYYKILDYAVFNHIGFKSYCGKRGEEEAFKTLISYGIKGVFVTKGSKGCSVRTPDMKLEFPAFCVDAVDATGAGDTFSASLLYALDAYDNDVKKATEFATAAAAIAVSGMGARAGAVSENTVLEFLSKNMI